MDKSYDELIVDQNRARNLIAGSYVTADHPIQAWEKGRKFIASEITHAGSLLDIGCANGFLLKSLQAWTPYALTPYGIDSKKEDIQQAKILFPEYTAHFVAYSLERFLEAYPPQFPELFDFIYWAVWVNYDLTQPVIAQLLDHVAEDGRLILGFYPESSEEPSDVRGNLDKLKAFGYVAETVRSPLYPARNEMLAIINR